MTPELEVLDQILDGSLPLHAIACLFPDVEHCKRALAAMLEDEQVVLLDPSGNQTPLWRYRELSAQPEPWQEDSGYRLAITDHGAQLVS